MKIPAFLKSNRGFFIVFFLLFIGVMFALYSNYPYYPAPMPNEFQPSPQVK
jgi:hypothetical protein